VNATEDQVVVEDCWSQIGVWGRNTCPKLVDHLHCRSCPVFTRAALRLLDREPPAEYLEHWARHYSTVGEGGSRLDGSVLVFRVGSEWFALPSSCVVEVSEQKMVHGIPHRRSAVLLGVLNIRGELVVTVSLGLALGVGVGGAVRSGEDSATGTRVVVVETGSGRLAMPVEEVAGVRRYDTRTIGTAPSTVARSAEHCLRGVLALDGRTLRVLDPGSLFSVLNRHLS